MKLSGLDIREIEIPATRNLNISNLNRWMFQNGSEQRRVQITYAFKYLYRNVCVVEGKLVRHQKHHGRFPLIR